MRDNRVGSVVPQYERLISQRQGDLWPEASPARPADTLDANFQTQTLEVKDVENSAMGQGLFAREDILKKKPRVFTCDGKKHVEEPSHSNSIYTAGESVQLLNAIVVDRIDTRFRNAGGILSQDLGKFLYVNPDPNSPLRYLNHSCRPNVFQSPQDPFTFMAAEDIASGQEITSDYSLMEANPSFRMECHCGSPDCRKTIRSIQFLPTEYVAKYWEIIPDFMRHWFLEKSEDTQVRKLVTDKGIDKADDEFKKLFGRIN